MQPAAQGRQRTSILEYCREQASSAARSTAGDVCQEPQGDNIGTGGAGASRRSKLAVARISWPSSNHQKPGGGIAERFRDPSCRRSSDQASRCLAARLQGSAIRGRFCAFLAPRAEHPNTEACAGGKTSKCSDVRMIARDAALRRLTVCQLPSAPPLISLAAEREEGADHGISRRSHG